MKKWKVPNGCSFLEIHDNDDCIVFYYKNNCNPEDVKAYLIPKEKKVTEPVKTYEEGFIAGFSHNIKTVEKLEERIKKAIEYIEENKLNGNKISEMLCGSEIMTLLEILKGEDK
jgi:hypothetical protein